MAEPMHVVGSTDQTIPLFLQGLTGAGETGLVAADLTAYYCRRRAAALEISLSDLAAVDSAHSDGGLKEIDATNMPGHYRLDLPDAVFAAGSPFAIIAITGAAILPCSVMVPLTQFDDAVMDELAAELLNDRLYTIEDGTEELLDTDDSVLATITPTGSISFTGANWTDATSLITKTGAFANYVWKTGDLVTLTAGTGVTLGQYEIASKVDADTIELATDINGETGNISDASIAGTIATGRVLRRRS